MKNLILKLIIGLCCLLPLASFADTNHKQHSELLSQMTVTDYVKLYYKDSSEASKRIKEINDDAVNFLMSADVIARKTQDVPLFCANKNNDPVNITADIFNDLMIKNLSKLDIGNEIISLKDNIPFSFYALGVMAETYPCQGTKKPLNFFQTLEKSYQTEKNKAFAAVKTP